MIKKEEKKEVKEVKKQIRKNVMLAKLYVTATFNNTLVSAADADGNVLAWETTGSSGFKGARKSTPYAATATMKRLTDKLAPYGIKEVEVYIKGPGPGRDAALRAIRAAGLKMNMIADVTPIPHNGTRPKKKRRI